MTWTAESQWAVPVGVLVIVGGIALSVATRIAVPGAAGLTAGIAVLHIRRIEVTVDETQLRTAFGPLHWPVVKIPIAEIERLEYVPDLRPIRYGGWGYRGSLRLVKRAAVILRRGPAVIFALTRNRRFIVTVDDAESLARAVEERIRP